MNTSMANINAANIDVANPHKENAVDAQKA
jgi:hypothetical protein